MDEVPLVATSPRTVSLSSGRKRHDAVAVSEGWSPLVFSSVGVATSLNGQTVNTVAMTGLMLQARIGAPSSTWDR
jgi:hypothetical protein